MFPPKSLRAALLLLAIDLSAAAPPLRPRRAPRSPPLTATTGTATARRPGASTGPASPGGTPPSGPCPARSGPRSGCAAAKTATLLSLWVLRRCLRIDGTTRCVCVCVCVLLRGRGRGWNSHVMEAFYFLLVSFFGWFWDDGGLVVGSHWDLGKRCCSTAVAAD